MCSAENSVLHVPGYPPLEAKFGVRSRPIDTGYIFALKSAPQNSRIRYKPLSYDGKASIFTFRTEINGTFKVNSYDTFVPSAL